MKKWDREMRISFNIGDCLLLWKHWMCLGSVWWLITSKKKYWLCHCFQMQSDNEYIQYKKHRTRSLVEFEVVLNKLWLWIQCELTHKMAECYRNKYVASRKTPSKFLQNLLSNPLASWLPIFLPLKFIPIKIIPQKSTKITQTSHLLSHHVFHIHWIINSLRSSH